MQVSVTYIKYCKNLIYDYNQIQVIIIPIMNSIYLFLWPSTYWLLLLRNIPRKFVS